MGRRGVKKRAEDEKGEDEGQGEKGRTEMRMGQRLEGKGKGKEVGNG